MYTLFFLFFLLCIVFFVFKTAYSHQTCMEALVIYSDQDKVSSTQLSIPHHIHQTWKTTDVPSQYAELVAEIKRLHPSFTYTLWTDSDNLEFVRRYFPWFFDVYISYDKHIKRVDAVRYLWLYMYGGVYIDLDSVTLQPLDTLLQDREMLFGYAERKKQKQNAIPNAFMAIAPRHPFMGWLIKQLPKTKHLDVIYATGPNFLTHCLREWKFDQYPYVVDMPILFTHSWYEKISIRDYTFDELRKKFPHSYVSTFWTHSWK